MEFTAHRGTGKVEGMAAVLVYRVMRVLRDLRGGRLRELARLLAEEGE